MLDKKTMTIAAVVIGVAGVVGGMVWSAEKEKHNGVEANQDIAMATSAKITIEEAMKTALENFPGKVIEAQLEKKQDKTVWEVEILTAEQGIVVVYVDADSGSVMTTEEKTAGKEPAQETKS
jgi:uncharacterized membrane protein YkoI